MLYKYILLMYLMSCCLFSNSQNYKNLKTEQSAVQQNQLCYTLTPDSKWKIGQVWSTSKVNLTQNVIWDFKLNFGSKPDPLGADGIIFILSPIPNITDTSSGRYLGYKDMKPSIGIEFDVFKNAIPVGTTNDFKDPQESHIAIHKNGNLNHKDTNCLTLYSANDGWVKMHPSKTNFQDGQFHDIKIEWIANTKIINVYVNQILRTSTNYDIISHLFKSNEVYWGISAATGGAFNHQQVCFSYDTTQQVNPPSDKPYLAPNVFTPNGDSKNDTWFINLDPSSGIKISNVYIYNRWGQLVYEGNTPWDGNYKGKPVPSGVYIYAAKLIYPNQSSEMINGEINVIR